jgi:hypothetical protein
VNIDKIKDAIEIAKLLGDDVSAEALMPHGWRKVIVRSRDAGVLYGEYAGNDGSTVHLRNARQLWKWFAAKGISLVDVATYGVKKSECKFSDASAAVTVFNACALIGVTDVAASSIEAV